ncbi:MAG: CRISPR-associated protein [Armatimonadetes bacterium]|nr:CRISPR-associated protein [Armatimonadota bacterium]
MHRVVVNEAFVRLKITPDGPVLIKAGDALSGIQPDLPDMAFVRTFHRGRETVYFPGSSLKGVIRSHCERIVRTCVPLSEDSPAACDPLFDKLERGGPRIHPKEKRVVSCCKWLQERHKNADGWEMYARSCFVCRLFGNTSLASHSSFGDAVPIDGLADDDDPNLTEERNGVAIDRIYGSVAGGALFQFEVVTRGTFEATIQLRNFTCAHLGLIGLALRDLNDQRLLVGFGKSRGLGRVKAEVASVTLRRWAPLDSGNQRLVGFLDPSVEQRYRLGLSDVALANDRMDLPVAFKPDDLGIDTAEISGDALKLLWTNAAENWASAAQSMGGG